MLEYIESMAGGYAGSMLNQTSSSGPCLVFVDRNCPEDFDSVRSWLNRSHYNTYEATDVFDAMEEMYDFMGSEVPDVIVVPGSADQASVLVDDGALIYSSGTEETGCIHSLTELAYELDSFFPPKPMPSNRASA